MQLCMKPKVIPRLFSEFKEAYPGLLPETNFESSDANCILNTPLIPNKYPISDPIWLLWSAWRRTLLLEIIEYHFEWHISNFTRHLSGVCAYDLSLRFIHIQYNFIVMLVFKMHAEGVLCKFCHIYIFKRCFWRTILNKNLWRPNANSQVVSRNKKFIENRSIKYKIFNKTRREFLTFSAQLPSDINCTD